MGFDNLKNAGFKPTENEEFGKIKKGLYLAELKQIAPTSFKTNDGKTVELYVAEYVVTSVISGDPGEGWIFQKKYNKNDDTQLQKMANDLFTLGVDISGRSDDEVEALLPSLSGTKAKIRASEFVKKTDDQGNIIPEDKRESFQAVRILSPKGKEKKKKEEKAADRVPF